MLYMGWFSYDIEGQEDVEEIREGRFMLVVDAPNEDRAVELFEEKISGGIKEEGGDDLLSGATDLFLRGVVKLDSFEKPAVICFEEISGGEFSLSSISSLSPADGEDVEFFHYERMGEDGKPIERSNGDPIPFMVFNPKKAS